MRPPKKSPAETGQKASARTAPSGSAPRRPAFASLRAGSVVEPAAEARDRQPLEQHQAHQDQQRPEDAVHVRLEEERHLRDREQPTHQDRGERRVGERPAEGVEQTRQRACGAGCRPRGRRTTWPRCWRREGRG